MAIAMEDRHVTGWPRGFAAFKKAQTVLRDAARVAYELERGFQGRYRIAPQEKPDAEDLLSFINASLEGTQYQEVEIIVIARSPVEGKEEQKDVASNTGPRNV